MTPGKASAVWTRETNKAAQYAHSNRTSPPVKRVAPGPGSASDLFTLSCPLGMPSTLIPYTRKHFRDQGALPPQLPICRVKAFVGAFGLAGRSAPEHRKRPSGQPARGGRTAAY